MCGCNLIYLHQNKNKNVLKSFKTFKYIFLALCYGIFHPCYLQILSGYLVLPDTCWQLSKQRKNLSGKHIYKLQTGLQRWQIAANETIRRDNNIGRNNRRNNRENINKSAAQAHRSNDETPTAQKYRKQKNTNLKASEAAAAAAEARHF